MMWRLTDDDEAHRWCGGSQMMYSRGAQMMGRLTDDVEAHRWCGGSQMMGRLTDDEKAHRWCLATQKYGGSLMLLQTAVATVLGSNRSQWPSVTTGQTRQLLRLSGSKLYFDPEWPTFFVVSISLSVVTVALLQFIGCGVVACCNAKELSRAQLFWFLLDNSLLWLKQIVTNLIIIIIIFSLQTYKSLILWMSNLHVVHC